MRSKDAARQLVFLGALFAPSLGLAEPNLDGASLRKLFPGRSASWVSAEGRTGVITYHPDGKISAKVKIMGMTMPIGGSWEIKGDRFCRTIRMDPTPTRCQTVVPVSGKTYRFYNDDGKLATTTTFD